MTVKNYIYMILVSLFVAACASMATPDGGPYDEAPPFFVSSTPVDGAVNSRDKKITLNFNEIIKLQNAFEKVVISPPQLQMPEIKYNGKRVTVILEDSLKPNTTYTIDFNDAIVDNNEGNALENFSFLFSTGSHIDTMSISGTVLEASDLEPIKGILVGLYSDIELADSLFLTTPFERVSRTDSRGRFTIRGIAPGKYKLYALNDANQNFIFDQKSEKVAFLDSLIIPYATLAVRRDTIWRDSLVIDSVIDVSYTRFQPDDIVLRAFAETLSSQYLVKYPRLNHNKFELFFSAASDTLPTIKGLNFDETDAFIIESNSTLDSLGYWIKDSIIFHKDTLEMSISYNVPDSAGNPRMRHDTIYVSPRRNRARFLEDEKKRYEEEEKNFIKEAKRKKDYDKDNPPQYIPSTKTLQIKAKGSSIFDINKDYILSFEEPILSIDTSFIRVSHQVDSLWEPIPYIFRQSKRNIRDYVIYSEWKPEAKYKIEIDSAAFHSLYGATSPAFKEEIRFKSLDEYATLYLNIPGTGDSAIVQLLGSGGSVVASERTENNRCIFYFLTPTTYYLRLFLDNNRNGKWDTGNFSEKKQPEEMFYYPRALELRALFEYNQDDWNIRGPLDRQKPLSITKQKPDREKVKRNRNAQRTFKK